MRKLIRCLVIGLVAAMLGVAGRMQAQSSTPSLAPLFGLVPADANSVDIKPLALSEPYAVVHYSRQELVLDTFSPSRPLTLTRDYDDIYRFDGTHWIEVIDGYAIAEQVIASVSGTQPYGDGDPIALGQDGPTPTTALVTLAIWPFAANTPTSSRVPGMPDALAVEVQYLLGPMDIQHPSPYYGVLLPSDSGVTFAFTTNVPVRGSIDGVTRKGNVLLMTAPAYVNSDPLCCATGTEYLELDRNGSAFAVGSRCRKSGRNPAIDVNPC